MKFITQSNGGTLQCGHIAILTNGEGEDATEGDLPGAVQVVQLPAVPCRKVVIACPTATTVTTTLNLDPSANARGLYYGDEDGQLWFLAEGQAEELEVSNLNQIYLRDTGFSWEDFNNGDHSLTYAVIALWRVIK